MLTSANPDPQLTFIPDVHSNILSHVFFNLRSIFIFPAYMTTLAARSADARTFLNLAKLAAFFLLLSCLISGCVLELNGLLQYEKNKLATLLKHAQLSLILWCLSELILIPLGILYLVALYGYQGYNLLHLLRLIFIPAICERIRQLNKLKKDLLQN